MGTAKHLKLPPCREQREIGVVLEAVAPVVSVTSTVFRTIRLASRAVSSSPLQKANGEAKQAMGL